MEEKQSYEVLIQIHKLLMMMANHLDALARVARHEHPELFKHPEPLPAASPDRS
jgi:hypothetical protein